jgi:hypothetical protein
MVSIIPQTFCHFSFVVVPGQGRDKFYKRSQGKNTSSTAGSFVGFQPTSLSRIILAFRSAISGRYAPLRSAFGFPCQRFSSL